MKTPPKRRAARVAALIRSTVQLGTFIDQMAAALDSAGPGGAVTFAFRNPRFAEALVVEMRQVSTSTPHTRH